MKTYKYTVKLTVEVESLDETDAWYTLQDTLAIGEMGSGVTVVDCEYKTAK